MYTFLVYLHDHEWQQVSIKVSTFLLPAPAFHAFWKPHLRAAATRFHETKTSGFGHAGENRSHRVRKTRVQIPALAFPKGS